MKSTVVSASDIGKATFCPHALSLQKNGNKLSEESELRLNFGTMKHKQLADSLSAQDTRCFIASHAFGANHFVTDHLRSWRDSSLKPSWLGRALVNGYYRTSPFLVDLAPIGTMRLKVLRWLVACVYKLTGGGLK